MRKMEKYCYDCIYCEDQNNEPIYKRDIYSFQLVGVLKCFVGYKNTPTKRKKIYKNCKDLNSDNNCVRFKKWDWNKIIDYILGGDC